ncbi:MAG: DUF3054 domain-containing protein [Anaerolineales bacterium]
MQNLSNRERSALFIGDMLTLAIVTIIGFASHGTADTAGTRMLTTFLPLAAAWFLIAPHLKVYESQIVFDWRQLWRPFWSMVLAAPMAAWMRGMILNAPILPLFVIILGGVSAVGILAWRGLFLLVLNKMKSKDG